MNAQEAAEIFQALANEHRVRIVRQLIEKALACADPGDCDLSERCCDVGELAGALDISPPTVSYHLKELRHAGLIAMERRGRHIYCAINEKRLDEAIACVHPSVGSTQESCRDSFKQE